MSERPEPTARREAAWIVALVALAVGVRLPNLGTSFYGDEMFSLLRDSSTWLTPSEDRFRPLYFSLLHAWRQLGFHGEAGLRGLSLLFGVALVPAGYALGRRLGGRRTAVALGVLLALDPVLVEFSQELRMYSLVSFIAVLQAWAFVEAAARSAEGAGRRSTLGPWCAFVAAGVAGVYTHLNYWLLLGGFAFAVLRRRAVLPLRQGAAALAAIAVLYLPDVPNVLRFQRVAGAQVHLLSTDLPSALPKLVAAYLVGFNYFHLPDLGVTRALRLSSLGPNLALAALVGVPAGAIVWQLGRRCRARDAGPLVWLSVELFLVPALVSLAAVFVTGRDFIHPKYMVFSAPFFSLLVIAGYEAIPRLEARIAVAGLGLGVLLIALVHSTQHEAYGRREDWRGAAAYLRTALDGDSELLMLASPTDKTPPCDPKAISLWEYYAPDLCPRARFVHLPSPDATPEEIAPQIALPPGEHTAYFLWSDTGRNFIDPDDVVLTTARGLWDDEARRQFDPRLVLYSWHAPDRP